MAKMTWSCSRARAPLLAIALVVAGIAAPATSIASNPTFVATSPADGETGVSPDLPSIVLTFSEPMSGGWSFSNLPSGWTGQMLDDIAAFFTTSRLPLNQLVRRAEGWRALP